MAQIIDGKAMAAAILDDVAIAAASLLNLNGHPPCLAVILVGDDPASDIYVRRKLNATRRVGIRSAEYRLPQTASEADVLDLIQGLNADRLVNGILVQLPLPHQIDAAKVLDLIAPEKDVDGFHPVNVGRLSIGSQGLVPCTPLGCMKLLESVVDDFRGLKAVVIGKSNVVGKPVALLLLERECTVTVTHILTRNLPDIVRTADIVVSAAGSPGLVRGAWVKPGAIVIDVGITRVDRPDGGYDIKGDAAGDELDHCHAYTPVPGGVGPMTIACLMSNTVRAARSQAHGC